MKKILCALSAILVVAGCEREQSNKPVIIIGMLYPLSGNAAVFGDTAKMATKMFFDDHQNTKYKYELVWEDSQANPATAVSAVRKLINFDKVDIILDMYSSVGLAVSPITNEVKIPHLTFAQDRNISNGFYNWRVVTSTKKTGEKTYNALHHRKLKNITAVVENTPGTLSLYEGFKHIAQKDKEMKITEIMVNPGERDFNVILNKINKNPSDIVLTVLQSPEVDVFMRQAKNNSLSVPITGVQSFTMLKDKSLADGIWYVDVTMATKEFLSKYNKISKNAPTNFAENFYTQLLVTVTNFEMFDTKPTAEEFINNLSVVDGVVSPLGKLIYDKDEQNIDTNASVRKVENGNITEIAE